MRFLIAASVLILGASAAVCFLRPLLRLSNSRFAAPRGIHQEGAQENGGGRHQVLRPRTRHTRYKRHSHDCIILVFFQTTWRS
jgi:hypothetical protein